MQSDELKIRLESALKLQAKLIKASVYYPSGHPALQAALTTGLDMYAPLLQRGELAVSIRKDGFSFDGEAVGPENAILKGLAGAFFVRRIHRLVFRPELSTRDLLLFSRCLTLEPARLEQLGGAQALLKKAGVRTVLINGIDPSLSSSEPEEAPEADPVGNWDDFLQESAPDLQSSRAARDIETILREVRKEKNPERFQLLVRELIPRVPPCCNEQGRHLALWAFAFLHWHAAGKAPGPSHSAEAAREALGYLATDESVRFLMDSLCRKALPPQARSAAHDLLIFYGSKPVGMIINRLSNDRDPLVRKLLVQLLVRQSAAAVPILLQGLGDERWYVVRNLVFILGEMRARDAFPSLVPLLDHEDVRVQREVLRAITRIGGRTATEILLQVAREGEKELRLPALISLGVLKDPASVPHLLKMVRRFDPLLRDMEIRREAIRVLGEMKAEAAIPTLRRILGRRRVWRRSHQDELSAAAAWALGEIGDPDSEKPLERACRIRSEKVSRMAAKALQQIRRGRISEPGTA